MIQRKVSKLTRPIALMLIVLLPAVATAQNSAASQHKSTWSKVRWIVIGGAVGGTTLALMETRPRQDATKSSSPACTTVQSGSAFGGAVVSSCGAVVAKPAAPVSPMSGTALTTISLPPMQQSRPNWKLIAPSIAVASISTFVLYRDYARTKKAELSVKPSGAELSFKW